MTYYGNEDAGDLEIMGRADFEGEMNAQREHAQRLAYVEQFDSCTKNIGYFPTIEVSYGVISDTINGYLPGPTDAPYCEGCCERLERSNPEGRYGPQYSLLYCSEECHDDVEYMAS